MTIAFQIVVRTGKLQMEAMQCDEEFTVRNQKSFEEWQRVAWKVAQYMHTTNRNIWAILARRRARARSDRALENLELQAAGAVSCPHPPYLCKPGGNQAAQWVQCFKCRAMVRYVPALQERTKKLGRESFIPEARISTKPVHVKAVPHPTRRMPKADREEEGDDLDSMNKWAAAHQDPPETEAAPRKGRAATSRAGAASSSQETSAMERAIESMGVAMQQLALQQSAATQQQNEAMRTIMEQQRQTALALERVFGVTSAAQYMQPQAPDSSGGEASSLPERFDLSQY